LHREQQQGIKDSLGAVYHDEDWAFCRHDGKMWDPKTFTAHVKKLYAEIGLPESLTLHNLRDDYTTARIDRGASIEEVSEDLDHESVAKTRGYDHETVERKNKAALEIENGLNFPAPPLSGQYAKAHFAGEQVTLGSVRDQHAPFTI
jgi:site-specific recombinase XerD